MVEHESAEHQEHKYIFPAGYKDAVLDWLVSVFLPDPAYRFGLVSSLYYDTAALSLFREKRNGDYLKNKVRLRWYDDVKCFLEVKRKHGALCLKKRLELPALRSGLPDHLFSDEEIAELPSKLVSLDYLPEGILLPMALIRYERYRFVDPESGSRFALDGEIRCTGVNELFFPGTVPVQADAGVLEIKGKSGELPRALYPVSAYLTKSEFSKYARCLERVMEPRGRIA